MYHTCVLMSESAEAGHQYELVLPHRMLIHSIVRQHHGQHLGPCSKLRKSFLLAQHIDHHILQYLVVDELLQRGSLWLRLARRLVLSMLTEVDQQFF